MTIIQTHLCDPSTGDSDLHGAELGFGHFLSRSIGFANSVQMWEGGGKKEMKQATVTDLELEGILRSSSPAPLLSELEVTSPGPTEVNGRAGSHALGKGTGGPSMSHSVKLALCPQPWHKWPEACQITWGKSGRPGEWGRGHFFFKINSSNIYWISPLCYRVYDYLGIWIIYNCLQEPILNQGNVVSK